MADNNRLLSIPVGNFLLTWTECLLSTISLFGAVTFNISSLGRWAFNLFSDGKSTLLFLLICIVSSLIAAFFLHRADPRRLFKWHNVVHTILAFYTAYMIMGYGASKLFKTQFQPPYFVMDTPIGELGGFWLTWVYYGHSMTLSYIIGFTQVIGGVLLTYRKTRLVATFILASVMVNICLINHFYDISYLAYFNSLHYTVNLFFLMLLDFEKLKNAFFSIQDSVTTKSAKFWILNAIRILLVFAACFKMYSLRNSFVPISKLNGKWDITLLKTSGQSIQPQHIQDSVWHRLYIEWRYGAAIRINPHIQNSKDLFGQYTLDENKNLLKIALSSQAGNSDSVIFNYRFANDSILFLNGTRNGDSIGMELKRAK